MYYVNVLIVDYRNDKYEQNLVTGHWSVGSLFRHTLLQT